MALVMSEFQYSERRACKLVSMDRTTYRYQPRPDHNAELRGKLIAMARQKPRYGYRRLCALLERGGCPASLLSQKYVIEFLSRASKMQEAGCARDDPNKR